MDVARNLAEVREAIAYAAESSHRDPSTITLIAVSKTFPPEVIRQAYDAGQRHFGESRLQEALPKIEALPTDIVWHYIGKLQSNKAKRVAQLFSVIHTLESESQLAEIRKSGRRPLGLVEVNTSGEVEKSGIPPDSVQDFCTRIRESDTVDLRGLMTLGPREGSPDASFDTLRNLGKVIGAEWLSMGMSGDFEAAIKHGATHVRVGTRVFKSRDR